MVEKKRINIKARTGCTVFFSLILMFVFYNHSLLNPFELRSDYLQYYNFYNSGAHNFDRFGVEIVTPVLFFLANYLGLSFYQFVFAFGVLWVGVLYHVSKDIRLSYIFFFYLYLVAYFIDTYAFLFRQSLAFFFFLLFFIFHSRVRYILLFLAIFSHLSAILFLFFSWVNLKSRAAYFGLTCFAILVAIYNYFGYSFSRLILPSLSALQGEGLQRKISIINRLNGDVDGAGYMILIILSISAFLHCFFIHKDSKFFSIMRAMFFSAVVSLLLSDFNIIANRAGFMAYFFSIPYFLLVASKFKLDRNFKIGFNN